MFGVTILGNNSALPAYDRHPTAQVVTLNDQLFLIDCGEGTQMQMSRYKIRRSKIHHVFISHLHGDHYYGLPGLITSMGLLGREQDLHIYGPAPLRQVIELQLTLAGATLPYPLHFHSLEHEGMILEEEKYSVSCFKVFHRIECWGFLIQEKRKPRKIDKERIIDFDIPTTFYEKLKMGEDYPSPSGEIIRNEAVTMPSAEAKSYAFCSDTRFAESLADKVKAASLLYHEATYLSDMEDRAASRFHATTLQAARIAQLSGAGKLLVGHFSSKYEVLDAFRAETQSVFANSDIALEGVTYLV